MRSLRITFNLLLVTAVLLVTWYLLPARLLYNPTAVEIDGAQVTVYRTYPLNHILGEPLIRYSEILRPLDGSTPCVDGAEFRYTDNGLPYGTWGIEHFAQRCIDNPSGYVYWVAWSPRLFDLIPLRPVELTITVHPPTQ